MSQVSAPNRASGNKNGHSGFLLRFSVLPLNQHNDLRIFHAQILSKYPHKASLFDISFVILLFAFCFLISFFPSIYNHFYCPIFSILPPTEFILACPREVATLVLQQRNCSPNWLRNRGPKNQLSFYAIRNTNPIRANRFFSQLKMDKRSWSWTSQDTFADARIEKSAARVHTS